MIMPESKAKEVAQLFGLELEEEFLLKGSLHKYKFTEDGLVYWSDDYQIWIEPCVLEDLLTGDVKITKLSSESILTEKEKSIYQMLLNLLYK